MADVFISYSRADQAHVTLLAAAMTRDGFDVWWDAELPPHRSYGDVITEQIAIAKAVIVVWSATAAASEWVRAEADLGRNQKKLIQASLDDCMPPMPFNQIQFAYIGDWRGEEGHGGWRKIRASLNELCGRTAPRGDTAAVPTPPPSPRHEPEPIPERKRSLGVPALALGALIAAGAVGVVLWNGSGAGESATPHPATEAAAPSDAAATRSAAPARTTARFNVAAVIDDPDGFSNVRDGPSARARILTRVEEGEAFTTFPQNTAWWQVRTADGTIGWMNRKLIKTLAPRDDAPPPAIADAEPTEAAPTAGGDVVLPFSSEERLDEADLANLSPTQLNLARNEIFARHGRRFARAELQSHFARFDWYRPTDDPSPLNALEKANVALLARLERQRGASARE